MICACGKPLHYTDLELKKKVDEIVAKFGPEIEVVVEGARYLVSRHYVALHGLKGSELKVLAKEGKVKEIK